MPKGSASAAAASRPSFGGGSELKDKTERARLNNPHPIPPPGKHFHAVLASAHWHFVFRRGTPSPRITATALTGEYRAKKCA
ncbi:hypothetical protein CSOJ01_01230 [Colletotrichum sojae]|uniref:Uncharacterized protein n=1 Tax=Colletotrichum sojae TaxID=2175907 RepID=A0A8H6JUT2_9PEZI|nr:hypothetical protein CSOJ01_01230 [Colletotrichum sojae]